MALGFKVVSADDHVQETPDVWTERLSKQKWGERIPQVARQPDGAERWMVDAQVGMLRPLAATGALASEAERFSDPETWEQVPKASYDPAERLKAMDQDEVNVQVLYPSAAGVGGEVLASIQDAELQLACVQAYNDWLIEVWAKASPRFVPLCLLPVLSTAAAVQELERAVKLGHRGATIPNAPWHLNQAVTHLYDPQWDPLWAKATELGVPICFHSGSDPQIMLDIYQGFDPAIARGFDIVRRPASNAMVVGKFIFSGIGERFPTLKAVFANTSIDYMGFQLEICDHEWERICRKGQLPYEMDTQPTNLFHRQCTLTTSFDNVGLKLRNIIGVSNIMWQSEFPFETSTFPKSAETLTKNFRDVPASDRDQIVSGNAARLFKVTL